MTAKESRIAFTLAVASGMTGLVAMAWRLESAGRLPSLLLGGATLGLIVVQLARDLRATAEEHSAPPREASAFCWTLTLPVAIVMLGGVVGAALHATLLVRYFGGRSWRLAGLLGGAVGVLVCGLAKLMAREELLRGVLTLWP